MKIFVLIISIVLITGFSGCKKVDKLLNGEDNIEVGYPGPDELPPPPSEDA